MKTFKELQESLHLNEIKQPYALVDTSSNNKVVGTSSELRDMKISKKSPIDTSLNSKDLMIVKTKKKQDIGFPLKGDYIKIEEDLNENLKEQISFENIKNRQEK